ncbi:acyltransferase family protein [Brachybacterium sp. NPDC056505]|uniref:acyltransferase family protein n=1 Tax=Brachybacterium sp. NPDC056505 TaxID=3345843 RepID=UPI003671EFB6
MPARVTWMDLYRGFAVVLVAAGHSMVPETNPVISHICIALSAYRIPALLFLSGVLLPRSLEKPTSVFLSGKLRRIVWPCVLWTAIMLGIFGIDNALHPRYWLLAEQPHTWYLDALVMFYLLGLLTRRIPPIVVALALLVVSLPVGMLGSPDDFPGMVWHRPWYGFFFFLGAALQPHLHRVIRAPWWIALIAAVFSVPWMVHVARLGGEANGGLLAALGSGVGLVVVLWAAPRVPRIAPVRALEWMGRNSIVIYLVHFPAMFAWHQMGFGAGGVLPYLLMFVLSVGAGVGAVLLRPWSRFLYEFPGTWRPRAESRTEMQPAR